MMRTYMAEALGTFALLFAGSGAIVANDLFGHAVTHVGVSLTFGLIVMAMIYAIGDISGAHINPAVTIGFCVAGRFPFSKAIPYIIFQCVGAIAASVVLKVLFPDHPNLGATLPSGGITAAFVFEVIMTFLLMWVILNVSVGAKEKGIMAGAAIGGVVALEALFGGPVSGASMNPARSLAPAIVSGELTALWLYIVAPVLGAVLAVGGYHCVRSEGQDPNTTENEPVRETA